MKFEKLKTLVVLVAFFIIVSPKSNAQTVHSDQNPKVAVIAVKQKKNSTVYSFSALTAYDEFKTIQRIQRINELTGDNATAVFKQNKIMLQVNPQKIKDEMLKKLLSATARSHGYDDFILQY